MFRKGIRSSIKYLDELWFRVLPRNSFGERIFCTSKLGETENFAEKGSEWPLEILLEKDRAEDVK
eukprot:4068220-Ditylum_brightwellii.AAC.1